MKNPINGEPFKVVGLIESSADGINWEEGLKEGNTYIRLTLQDGGELDEDGQANGIIVDPSGIAISDSNNVNNSISTSGGGGGGCFIATAAYGSYLEHHLFVLRQFRDNYLLTNDLGKLLVKIYYKYSPPIANYVAEHDWAKYVVRLFVSVIVFTLEYFKLFILLFALFLLFFEIKTKKETNSGRTI